jgi:hypothetical protein
LNTRDVLLAKLESPEYTAKRLCVPPDENVAFRDATPPAKPTVPRFVLPLKKVTVPVGAPKVDVTVATSVTVWLMVDGVGVTDSAVTEGYPPTPSSSGGEELG